MSNLPANIKTALTERNIDIAVWTTLQNSVFPGAKDESILLAIDYCKARKLDILKKPCHIVPMSVTLSGEKDKNGYDKKIWRDVIMPGIYEQRITAFRTGQMAGQDEPVFGETINYKNVNAPEWCKVTVYRLINNMRCAFSHTEYFVESCATTKDGDINSVWTKRPRGQLAKCAEAGALRKAFPDELGGVITADEVVEDLPSSNKTENTIVETIAVELVSNEQLAEIEQLIKETQSDVAKLLAYFGKANLENLTAVQATAAIQKLKQKLKQASQPTAPTNDKIGEEIPL